MEDVYINPRFKLLFTKKIDLKTYFSKYSDLIRLDHCDKRKDVALKSYLDIDDENEYNTLKQTMNPRHGKYLKVPKSFVPKRRFLETWALYDIPTFETNLATINNTKKENREEKYRRMKTTKYPGKIILDVEKEPDDFRRVRNLFANTDYMISIRVLSLLGRNKKFAPSQEMLVPAGITLQCIKDRIICEKDCSHPFINSSNMSKTEKQKMDKNKLGMFYIGDTFYVNNMWGLSPKSNYCEKIQQWMSSRGLNPGNVKLMETTVISDVFIRLGYPYLYLHQGKCEHLIVVTDARLVKQTDLLFSEDYPLLSSFASLRGTPCVLCLSRLAKLCISDCEGLPYENAFICNQCAFSYLYNSEGQKKFPFKCYKYIDRSALI